MLASALAAVALAAGGWLQRYSPGCVPFVGQFGLLFQERTGLRRCAVLGTYAAGASASSALFGLAANSAAGKPVHSALGDQRSLLLAATLAGALLAVDWLRVWNGRVTSFGLGRQTPYDWRSKGLLGVLGWGLDTGLPVSTVRATPLPVLGVVLLATGHAGPFHGLLYGAGVASGVAAGVPSARSALIITEAMNRLTRRRLRLGPTRLVLAPGVVILTALLLLWVIRM